MAVLTSLTNPSALLNPTSANNNVLSLLSPALTHSRYLAVLFHYISTSTLLLLFRAYLLSFVLLRQGLYASQVLLVQSYYAAELLSRNFLFAIEHAMRLGWKYTEPLRRKLAFELAVFVLGSGNGLFLILFWPGWIVIGGVLGLWWATH